MHNSWIKLFKVLLYVFAAIGFFLTAGWAAVNWHLTDAAGEVDLHDRYLAEKAKQVKNVNSADPELLAINVCKASVIKQLYPDNGGRMLSIYERTRSSASLSKMIIAAEMYALINPEYVSAIKKCENDPNSLVSANKNNLYAWIDTPEWQTMKEALAKDKEVIARVSAETGIPERLIVAQVVGEQLRLFHSNREVFKQFFQPLKILGNEVQFSLGVAGIKEDTAKQIERNLKDKNSEYYIGSEYENMLSFKTANVDDERFERLTDSKDRYYSYLYTALFLKQIEKQWASAGYDISDRPEILATIFNIGFRLSKPKVDPEVGGADISIGDTTYTFGGLAYEFFYSGEMADEFPLD